MLARWQLDLLLSGWSIIYKGRVLKKEWSEHLRRTKQFLTNSLEGGADLHVLGAGRLLDFPLKDLLERYQEIHLYDGDLGAVRYFKKLKKNFPKIEPHLAELTGGLSKFRSKLDKFDSIDNLFSHLEFADFVDLSKEINISPEGQVVSLNLLSQLPLGYRQVFERWILNRCGRKFHKEKEVGWLTEYNQLGQNIIRSHTKLLTGKNPRKVVLISDTEQIFYPTKLNCLPTPKEIPFSWEVDSGQIEPLEVTSSICGLDLNPDLFPGYKITKKDFWPWNLAKAQRGQMGIVCRVDALELKSL